MIVEIAIASVFFLCLYVVGKWIEREAQYFIDWHEYEEDEK